MNNERIIEIKDLKVHFPLKENTVKAASDIFAPVSGNIIEVNHAPEVEPGLANSDPSGNGWFFKITIKAPGQLDDLMNESEYRNITTD